MVGARCLDLFAGSGALGFEALSRGARHVVMVERDTGLVRRLESSKSELGAARADIVRADAFEWLRQVHGAFDLVFLDPPFRQGRLPGLCALLAEGGHLAARALVYIEAERGAAFSPAGFTSLKQARAGQVESNLYQYEVTMKLTAIYPGAFDPITNGHVDIVERATRMFGGVIVAVAESAGKSTTFTVAERVELAGEVLAGHDNVEITSFRGLMTAYAKQRRAQVIVRGLRAVSDFEYEFKMASMNRQLYDGAETVFLTPAEHLSYISSSLVREIAALGGDVTRFVHGAVHSAMRRKFST